MSSIYSEDDLIKLIQDFEKAISDKDLDKIIFINGIFSQLIKNDSFSDGFFIENSGEMKKLYSLIRDSEALVKSMKEELMLTQSSVSKKKKSSKKYNDIGKL